MPHTVLVMFLQGDDAIEDGRIHDHYTELTRKGSVEGRAPSRMLVHLELVPRCTTLEWGGYGKLLCPQGHCIVPDSI